MADKQKNGFCIPYAIRNLADKGLGVFAGGAVRRGTVVWRHVRGQYAVHDESSLTALLSGMTRDEAIHELEHMFGLPEFPDHVIRVFDHGVLINHSRQPTVELNHGFRNGTHLRSPRSLEARGVEKLLLDDRFALIAKQDLEVGDELTQDYNAEVADPAFYDALCRHYGVSWPWL